MKLKNAAKLFDTCPVYDGYSGALLFKVQTSTFLESSVEGSTASRRVISLAPELVPPAHSVLLALSELWVLGASNPDEWKGGVIRRAYWTKKVTDNFKLLTPAQACTNAVGTAIYGSKKYLRETINTQTDAELDPMWDIFVSASAQFTRGYFLKSANTLYRVRVTYTDVDGFKTCQSDEIDQGAVVITFQNQNVYNPVSDTYAPSVSTAQGLVIDYSKAFNRQEVVDFKVEPGDLCLLVPKASTLPAVGQLLTVNAPNRYSGNWKVLSVQDEHDAYNLHIRRQ